MQADIPHRRIAMLPPGTDRRTGVSTILLGLAVAWLLLMAYLLYRNLPEKHVIPLFLLVALTLSLAAFATTRSDAGRQIGSVLLWGTFGATLSIWMVGIFSIGWLFSPVLLLEMAALIAWPRPNGVPVITKAGLLAEISGFLMTPAIFVPFVLILGGF